MGQFTSKDSAIVFLTQYKPDILADDIPDYFVSAAEEEINERTDTQWEIDAADQTFLIDGRGENFIHVPVVPIISLTEITIIHNDETETKLSISGSLREVRFNLETGSIHRIANRNNVFSFADTDEQDFATFPRGQSNIRVIGKFGRTGPTNILRLIANLLILRQMKFKDPESFKPNLKGEKIGKYEYTLQTGGSKANEVLNLDGYINYLFSILPHDDEIFIEAV